MNRASKRLGMTQSSWVNPNGLPAENQISSARDLGILARALLHDFPEYGLYWHIPAIQFGKRVMRNYNTLIGRYDGADGMKTGFICASGFNLVASATRRNKQLIAVVLGSPSSPYRGAKAAGLLERGFNRGALSWLTPSLGSVDSLQPINVAPPDLRDAMCGSHRKRPAAEDADEDSPTGETGSDTPKSFLLSSLPPGQEKPSSLLSARPAAVHPIVVHAGPPKKPAETQFAAVRARLAKANKNARADALKRDPHTAPVPPPQAAPAATATAVPAAAPAAAQPAQVASAPPSSAFAPHPGAFASPPTQFKRSGRAMPAASDVGNPSWMSFAPAARAANAPAPLTATPDAKPELQVAAIPMPRPRPKIDVKRKRR
jgi:D-alanyl-D-alanine carboxypeptidase